MGAAISSTFRASEFSRSPLAKPRGGTQPDLTPGSVHFSLSDGLLDDGSTSSAASSGKSSNMATFLNLINNYVGMVLLSMHYCFGRSGWLALPALVALTAFGAFTGECIILCCKTLQSRPGHDCPSYAEIGQACLGSFGKWLVFV